MPAGLSEQELSSMRMPQMLGMIAATLLGCGSSDSGTSTPLRTTAGSGGTHVSAAIDSATPQTIDGDCKSAPPETGGLSALEVCQHHPVELATIEATSPLGFSARDLLELAAGEHTTPLSWEGDAFVPEAPGGSLHVVLSARDSKPRYVESTPDPALSSLMPGCASSMEVDVHVQVTSDDGALNESYDAVLRAQNADRANIPIVQLASMALHGQLTLSPVVCNTGLRFAAITLAFDFAASGMSGQINAQLTQESALQSITLARFGA
jgi:hypothetical protein